MNLPVCTATSSQRYPEIVSDGAGGAIITWLDFRNLISSDVYAQHVLASGVVDPAWPVDGRALCIAASEQINPTIVSDGAGGAVVAWEDYRNGAYPDIYAQRVLASGAVDPAWPTDGRALCTAPDVQGAVQLVSDGAGGAIVAWMDFRNGTHDDIYAQRVLASGAVDPAWPANGRALCAATGSQGWPELVSDGAGGAIVTWDDERTGPYSDVYAQHVLASGAVDPAWPTNGRGLCTATKEQTKAKIVSDGAGGAIVTWSDARLSFASPDIYAQRVLASGAVDPAWPADGLALCTATGRQHGPELVSDGTGGAIAVWDDTRATGGLDLYAQRVLASGAVDPAWPADGVAVCTAPDDQLYPKLASDGAGGVIVTWQDQRSGVSDIYAQRVLISGAVDMTWPSDRAVSLAANSQEAPRIVSDGRGGAVVTWNDFRTTPGGDIYAQRVAPFGFLGSPEPVLASVADLPDDQGGRVRIKWFASDRDVPPNYNLGWYGIWRQVTEAAATQAIARGARMAGVEGAIAAERGVYRAAAGATATTWWEGVGMVAARGEPWYTFVAETFRDSTGSGNPQTTFMVDAHMARVVGFWDSAPMSGYSVDNLAPAAPAPFTGQYVAGTARLHWNRNLEYDLAGYRLYRGATASFVPGPGNLLAALPDTGYADAAGTRYVYKLTAIDLHGNESPVATLEFPGPTGVGEVVVPRELSFAAPSPNPAATGTTLRYGLPQAAQVRLAVYDAAGRLVRELASGAREAGEHTEAWDLRGADGRAAGAGLYFARLEVADHRALTRRIAVTR